MRAVYKNIKDLLKRSKFVVGLARALRGGIVDIKVVVWSARRQRKIKSYLRTSQLKKLHIGASEAAASNGLLQGWLNTDLMPNTSDVVYLDATRHFPIKDNTFDYVFSEHMVEHVDYSGALAMLQECYRVLKSGGRVRIATPDLEVLIGLRSKEKTDSQTNYVRWITEKFMPNVHECKEVFVINNAFHAWGHRFLYDRETLRATLLNVGFRNVAFYKPGVSEDENLRGLESHGTIIQSEEINQFETFVAEAQK